MGRKKKNTAGTPDGNLSTLKIGSRVRCTDDGVTGRIVWANGVAVKIKWDDGEEVTWKRESLAGRPLEILDADGADDRTPAPAATDAAAAEATATTAQTQETTATEPLSAPTAPASEPVSSATAQNCLDKLQPHNCIR